mgnify:FL=1
MFTSIVFSKDRALQLDLTLKSINQNLEYCSSVTVLYSVSSKDHEDTYTQLAIEHPNIDFVKQGYSIFEDIDRLVSASNSNYISFFTDDDIVYRRVEFTEEDIDALFSNESLYSCISLRLGRNTVLRDYGDGVMRQDFTPSEVGSRAKGRFIVWNRTTIPVGGYWAYPLSVDGHIFERSTIQSFCKELLLLDKHYAYQGVPREKFCWEQTPNEFEAKLQRFFFDLPPLMAAPSESCVVNSPNNRVQETIQNRNGDTYSYSSGGLATHFKEGRRLALSEIPFSDIACPHQEIDILEGLE